jgi:hypothetical protein
MLRCTGCIVDTDNSPKRKRALASFISENQVLKHLLRFFFEGSGCKKRHIQKLTNNPQDFRQFCLFYPIFAVLKKINKN